MALSLLAESRQKPTTRNGSLKPKFHRGQLVGHEPVHHDQIHMFLLKGRRPEIYRDGTQSAAAATVPMDVIQPEVSIETKIDRMKKAMVKFGYPPASIE